MKPKFKIGDRVITTALCVDGYKGSSGTIVGVEHEVMPETGYEGYNYEIKMDIVTDVHEDSIVLRPKVQNRIF